MVTRKGGIRCGEGLGGRWYQGFRGLGFGRGVSITFEHISHNVGGCYCSWGVPFDRPVAKTLTASFVSIAFAFIKV